MIQFACVIIIMENYNGKVEQNGKLEKKKNSFLELNNSII